MGNKVHPYGYRLATIREPKSTWFAEGAEYRENLVADLKVRELIDDRLEEASVSDVHIERSAEQLTITIETAKPGIVIGRGGRDVERLRQEILKIVDEEKVRVNVTEAEEPDINAMLVAENIARQIERRVSFRRAMRQAVDRAVRLGAEGIRMEVSGRLQGAEIARRENIGPVGRLPLHTLRGDVDYGFTEAKTTYGNIGVKVWIFHGEILPPKDVKEGDRYVPEEAEEEEVEEEGQEEVEEEQQAEEETADGDTTEEPAATEDVDEDDTETTQESEQAQPAGEDESEVEDEAGEDEAAESKPGQDMGADIGQQVQEELEDAFVPEADETGETVAGSEPDASDDDAENQDTEASDQPQQPQGDEE